MKKLMGATRCFFATKKITMYFFVAICLQLLGIQAGILRTGAIASAMEHTDELGKYLIPVIGWMDGSGWNHNINCQLYEAALKRVCIYDNER